MPAYSFIINSALEFNCLGFELRRCLGQTTDFVHDLVVLHGSRLSTVCRPRRARKANPSSARHDTNLNDDVLYRSLPVSKPGCAMCGPSFG